MTSKQIESIGNGIKFLFVGAILGGATSPYPAIHTGLFIALMVAMILSLAWWSVVREREIQEEINQILDR